MKKFLVLLVVVVLFIACDYASESLELKPDIEIVYMNPVGWYTSVGDTNIAADIDTIAFVAENSVDCYIEKMVWEYYDEDDSLFAGPEEIAIYFKIEGRVDPYSVDTFMLYGVKIPLLPVWTNIPAGSSARVLLQFIAVDEYSGTNYDTTSAWYGIYMWP